jgi:hypothetical protein
MDLSPLLLRLLGSIIVTIRFLESPNCALSIVEGRYSFAHELAPLNITYHFTTSDIDPKAGSGVDRVETLAILRNQAFLPRKFLPRYDRPLL